eukprot:16843-Heterococcus_DN1.PRE.1
MRCNEQQRFHWRAEKFANDDGTASGLALRSCCRRWRYPAQPHICSQLNFVLRVDIRKHYRIYLNMQRLTVRGSEIRASKIEAL